MENFWTKSERKTLIIGYGNPLRGDDAVGPLVASRLGGIVVHQLNPELAEPLAAASLAIFIDARQDLSPGSIEICPIEGSRVLTHHCTPAYLVQLARDVYGRAPHALLVGIGAESFECGASLSQSAGRGARRAAREIERRLRQYGRL
jgi:hydrogenase maturation protease